MAKETEFTNPEYKKLGEKIIVSTPPLKAHLPVVEKLW
jgi:hypothetical protein